MLARQRGPAMGWRLVQLGHGSRLSSSVSALRAWPVPPLFPLSSRLSGSIRPGIVLLPERAGSVRFFATAARPRKPTTKSSPSRKAAPGSSPRAKEAPRQRASPSAPAPTRRRQADGRAAAAASSTKQAASHDDARKRGGDVSDKVKKEVKTSDVVNVENKKKEEKKKLQGLMEDLQRAFDDMKFPNGFTDIQYYGIPEILKRKDTILASPTGTGKTLAYLLPVFQLLHADEKAGKETIAHRPPCLILLPNRELSKQVLSVVKSLSHYVKLRSAGITSGVKVKIQKESLAAPIDILVTTPGRLLQHFDQERIYFSNLRYLVIDEGDTLFDETFKEDIGKVLTIVRKRVDRGDKPPQTIVVTATVTSELSSAIDAHFPNATLVATNGLHRPLARLRHDFVDITTNDKHEPLLKVLLGSKTGGKTIVFCNDLQSARSTHHFLTEQGFNASCLHSGILPKRRAEYFEQFRSGECPILVCTDIASRGLDTVSVDHVVLFDFPETVTGYLHRVGRTARGGRRGRVTCLLKKGEKVFGEAIELANKKQITLSDVLPFFENQNPQRRKRLAAWLDPLALLPSQKNTSKK